ncbi:UNVERIFIED_CONTAM: hypothetical protein K2H54_065498 [Gekko kuhli]
MFLWASSCGFVDIDKDDLGPKVRFAPTVIGGPHNQSPGEPSATRAATPNFPGNSPTTTVGERPRSTLSDRKEQGLRRAPALTRGQATAVARLQFCQRREREGEQRQALTHGSLAQAHRHGVLQRNPSPPVKTSHRVRILFGKESDGRT